MAFRTCCWGSRPMSEFAESMGVCSASVTGIHPCSQALPGRANCELMAPQQGSFIRSAGRRAGGKILRSSARAPWQSKIDDQLELRRLLDGKSEGLAPFKILST